MNDESGSEEYEVVEETVVVETTETKKVEHVNTVEVTIEGEGRESEPTKQVTGEIITEDITEQKKDKTDIELDVERTIEIEKRREGENVQTETIKGEKEEEDVHIVTIEGAGSKRQGERSERQANVEGEYNAQVEVIKERYYQGGYDIKGQYTGIGLYNAQGQYVGIARYNAQGMYDSKGEYDADGKFIGQGNSQQYQGRSADNRSSISSSHSSGLIHDLNPVKRNFINGKAVAVGFALVMVAVSLAQFSGTGGIEIPGAGGPARMPNAHGKVTITSLDVGIEDDVPNYDNLRQEANRNSVETVEQVEIDKSSVNREKQIQDISKSENIKEGINDKSKSEVDSNLISKVNTGYEAIQDLSRSEKSNVNTKLDFGGDGGKGTGFQAIKDISRSEKADLNKETVEKTLIKDIEHIGLDKKAGVVTSNELKNQPSEQPNLVNIDKNSQNVSNVTTNNTQIKNIVNKSENPVLKKFNDEKAVKVEASNNPTKTISQSFKENPSGIKQADQLHKGNNQTNITNIDNSVVNQPKINEIKPTDVKYIFTVDKNRENIIETKKVENNTVIDKSKDLLVKDNKPLLVDTAVQTDISKPSPLINKPINQENKNVTINNNTVINKTIAPETSKVENTVKKSDLIALNPDLTKKEEIVKPANKVVNKIDIQNTQNNVIKKENVLNDLSIDKKSQPIIKTEAPKTDLKGKPKIEVNKNTTNANQFVDKSVINKPKEQPKNVLLDPLNSEPSVTQTIELKKKENPVPVVKPIENKIDTKTNINQKNIAGSALQNKDIKKEIKQEQPAYVPYKDDGKKKSLDINLNLGFGQNKEQPKSNQTIINNTTNQINNQQMMNPNKPPILADGKTGQPILIDKNKTTVNVKNNAVDKTIENKPIVNKAVVNNNIVNNQKKVEKTTQVTPKDLNKVDKPVINKEPVKTDIKNTSIVNNTLKMDKPVISKEPIKTDVKNTSIVDNTLKNNNIVKIDNKENISAVQNNQSITANKQTIPVIKQTDLDIKNQKKVDMTKNNIEQAKVTKKNLDVIDIDNKELSPYYDNHVPLKDIAKPEIVQQVHNVYHHHHIIVPKDVYKVHHLIIPHHVYFNDNGKGHKKKHHHGHHKKHNPFEPSNNGNGKAFTQMNTNYKITDKSKKVSRVRRSAEPFVINFNDTEAIARGQGNRSNPSRTQAFNIKGLNNPNAVYVDIDDNPSIDLDNQNHKDIVGDSDVNAFNNDFDIIANGQKMNKPTQGGNNPENEGFNKKYFLHNDATGTSTLVNMKENLNSDDYSYDKSKQTTIGSFQPMSQNGKSNNLNLLINGSYKDGYVDDDEFSTSKAKNGEFHDVRYNDKELSAKSMGYDQYHNHSFNLNNGETTNSDLLAGGVSSLNYDDKALSYEGAYGHRANIESDNSQFKSNNRIHESLDYNQEALVSSKDENSSLLDIDEESGLLSESTRNQKMAYDQSDFVAKDVNKNLTAYVDNEGSFGHGQKDQEYLHYDRNKLKHGKIGKEVAILDYPDLNAVDDKDKIQYLEYDNEGMRASLGETNRLHGRIGDTSIHHHEASIENLNAQRDSSHLESKKASKTVTSNNDKTVVNHSGEHNISHENDQRKIDVTVGQTMNQIVNHII